jgi:hypothetical protein
MSTNEIDHPSHPLRGFPLERSLVSLDELNFLKSSYIPHVLDWQYIVLTFPITRFLERDIRINPIIAMRVIKHDTVMIYTVTRSLLAPNVSVSKEI